tara:strand:- start:793 stop:1500 length:708 start_codon:yes stop_codon:yes gene_type:complete
MAFLKYKNNLKEFVPYVMLVILIYTFSSLGIWQLDRAKEKKEALATFNSSEGYELIDENSSFEIYKKIKATGQYDGSRQIIIDNIIREDGIGQMIVTPFRISKSSKILLVNRGWIKKKLGSFPDINELDQSFIQIQGLSGVLPKVTIRDQEAFEQNAGWPLIASYPTFEEIENKLGEPVFPFSLLLDQKEKNGFIRDWDLKISGPATNYGYAVQWFLMCFCSIVFLIYRIKKYFF